MTQQEEGGGGHLARQLGGEGHKMRGGSNDVEQSDEAGVDNTRQLDGGQYEERRGVENPTRPRTTC